MRFRVLSLPAVILVTVMFSGSRATACTLFWTERSVPALRAANLDGSLVRTFVPSTDLGTVVAVDPNSAKIYWTDGNAIVRSSLNGTNEEVLVSVGRAPEGMAIDLDGGKLYWTGPTTDKIERMNLDGTGLETLVTLPSSANPQKIVIDSSRNKMYWTESEFHGTSSIRRADLDGTNVELFQGSLPPVTGLALDPSSGNVYWTEPTEGIIRRSDPTGTVEILLSGLAFPRILYIDVSSNQLYWSVDGNVPELNNLYRGDLNAENSELVIGNLRGSYHELAVNPVSGQLYWAMVSSVSRAARIERADLDGNNNEILIGGWLNQPHGVAVHLEGARLYWRDRHSILSRPLNGATLPREEVSVSTDGYHLAVHQASGDIFWGEQTNCETGNPTARIMRYDGLFATTVLPGVHCPAGIAIDDVADKFYWIEAYNSRIRRANLDGTASELVMVVAASAIAIDGPNEKIYFAARGAISSASLDGTGVQELVPAIGTTVADLALDQGNARMYWTVDSSVYSANIDGTDVIEIITGLNTPFGIAVVGPPSALSGEPDCNGNGIPDDCDLGGASDDCNGNGIPDECEIADGTSGDCTGNGIPDECEIADGTSDDCNGNGVPDECEPDCNTNGVADGCDIAAGTSDDCAGNGVPDECEIADGTSGDCNGNSVLDECEPDCNGNGIPNECDILDGTSEDLNGDGVPDECQCPPSPPGLEPLPTPKNRYLTLSDSNAGQQIARRVTFVELPPPFNLWNGSEMWVGPTSLVSESASNVAPIPDIANFNVATLQCTPHYADWNALGAVHVFHEGIVPGGTYQFAAIDETCDPGDPASFSATFGQTTAIFGDTLLDLSADPPAPPEGVVNLIDAIGIIGAFQGVAGAIVKVRADLEPSCPDLTINISDVLSSLQAFFGLPYQFTPSAADPCDSTCVSPVP